MIIHVSLEGYDATWGKNGHSSEIRVSWDLIFNP